MTREDINDIINAICPNDEDYEKPCISPKYLRQELEQLALDQRQWNEEPTTKNNLVVDCISRADVLKLMQDNWHTHNGDWAMQESMDDIRALPSVTPQESQTFKWCTDCREYDQEKHCCHRWSKVIRDTVEEMKQEPIKPMVEIDLYSVIKQKYIEREVLDKIRAEIETKYGQCKLTEYIVEYDGICTGRNKIGDIADILQIIDKYKAETEST